VFRQSLTDSLISPCSVHPGFVYTGFGGGEDQERRSGQRGVEESARGVIEAIDSTKLDNTGAFLHGNYGEGVKTLPW
jgi:tubulin alpha